MIPMKTTQRGVWVWCEEMGWHNKTPLEYLALIGSEVGEAVNECRGEMPTIDLEWELADIVIRIMDFAETQGIDLGRSIDGKMLHNRTSGKKPGRIK